MSLERHLADLKRAAEWLYEDDPEWVEGGCADMSGLLLDYATKRGMRDVRLVVGMAARRKNAKKGFPHVWLEVGGERFDPSMYAQGDSLGTYVEGVELGRLAVAGSYIDRSCDVREDNEFRLNALLRAMLRPNPSGRGGIGRRARLKIEFLDRSASSTLAAPTTNPVDLKGRSIPERYLAGLPKAVQKARVRELTRSRDAYGKGDYSELPSDRIARQMGLVKKSAYSEVAEARGIEWRGDEAEMARRVCAHYKVKCTPAVATAIRSSFNKGLAAWKSGGHRPGATAQNWAVARVASLVVGGKTSLTADQKGFASFPAPLQRAIATGRPDVVRALLAQGRENDAAVVHSGT